MTAVWNASPVMFKNREERKKERRKRKKKKKKKKRRRRRKEEEQKKKKKEKRKNHTHTHTHTQKKYIKIETVTRLIDSVPVHVSDNTCLTRTVCVIGREL